MPYVSYSLKGKSYRLKFDGIEVYVDKNKWKNVVNERRGYKINDAVLAGGLDLDTKEIERVIG